MNIIRDGILCRGLENLMKKVQLNAAEQKTPELCLQPQKPKESTLKPDTVNPQTHNQTTADHPRGDKNNPRPRSSPNARKP